MYLFSDKYAEWLHLKLVEKCEELKKFGKFEKKALDVGEINFKYFAKFC